MAQLITKVELLKKIVEMQKVFHLMTSDDQRVCEKCFALYIRDERTRNVCYCDYESDRYDG